MPSQESSPRRAPVEVTERVGRGRERFATVPTHLPGVSLRTEPDVEVDILRKTVEDLALLAAKYAERKLQIDELTSQQRRTNLPTKRS